MNDLHPDCGNPSISLLPTRGVTMALYDFSYRLPGRPRILLLKLDYLGDFIIGVRSLQKIR